jgi:hypothetical protein
MRGLQPVRHRLPGARVHHPAHLKPGETDLRTGKRCQRHPRQLDHASEQPDAQAAARLDRAPPPRRAIARFPELECLKALS